MNEKQKILIDCGTGYAKLLRLDGGAPEIIPAKEARDAASGYDVVAATGHNSPPGAGKYVNELVALAEGALSLVGDTDFTVLDCGARDVKYVFVKDGKVTGMDWNMECGAFTGQTVELLIRYFGLNVSKLPVIQERLPVVCGILGMTAMFDLISQGETHETAFAKFLRGVAFNCENLVGHPSKLYLSGGMCDNPAFVKSFNCETIPLGRFVLLEGLRRIYDS